VKLFNQTLLADMEMLYIKETVFGVLDGAPLMDCTHPCLVALIWKVGSYYVTCYITGGGVISHIPVI
jgi:hypothetical protein